MEATSTAGPGGAGVAIKFRAATVATEKRAAVRAAIQQLPAAARSAETEKSSPRASMRASMKNGDGGWDDAEPATEEDVAMVGALREQLRQLLTEGGSYQAVIHSHGRTGVARRCIVQADACGRMAAWPRLEGERGGEHAVSDLRDTSAAPYAFWFIDEVEHAEVTAGDLSELEQVEQAHGKFEAEADARHVSGWVWVEEKQKKKTFVKRWAQLDARANQLSWFLAPPDVSLPVGMDKLLAELTADTPEPAKQEHVKAVTLLSADTAGGHAEATSTWLAENLTAALAEGSVNSLFKTLIVLQIMVRSGSSDLASGISLNCRPAVMAATSFDSHAADVSSVEAAERACKDIHTVAEQLLLKMNAAEPRSPSDGVLPIATATLSGCNSSPPKTSRKDFPYSLRVDLAQPDTAGMQKYILGFQSAATMQMWRDGFTSTTGATGQTRLSSKGKVMKTRRAVSDTAVGMIGLERANLSTESVCEITLHFASVVDELDDGQQDAGVATLGEEDAAGRSGTAPKRRAGLGTEPLRLGFGSSMDAQEFCSIVRAQLERYKAARARTLPQLRVVTQRLNQTFSGDSDWDMQQLRSLWSLVYDDREYVQGTSEFETAKAWVSDGWRDMGFQNADPSTDLRAMGMLGVHCLLRLAETRTDYVRAICAVAGSRAGCYPFALTGINLGKLMVDLLRLRQVDPRDITDADDPGPSLLRCWQTPLIALFCHLPEDTEDVFEAVFARLVQVFERAWLMSGCTSVMDFAAVYDRVAVALREHLERRGTLDELDQLTINTAGLAGGAGA